MAVNIGPRIEIDGEARYRQQISQITAATRGLKSEMGALESSFGKQKTGLSGLGSALTNNAQKRSLLKQQIVDQKQAMSDLDRVIKEAEASGTASAAQLETWKGKLNEATQQLNEMENELASLPSSLETIGTAMQQTGQQMTNIGRTLTTHVTAPIVGVGVLGTKAFIDFENAFTGVKKTVDASEGTYAALQESIKGWAAETGIAKEEIAGTMEVVGQLGVEAGKNGETIMAFTQTMEMLGYTTNLSAQEAATSLAQFTNITGLADDQIGSLGNVIVSLGNNFATTESDIVALSTRMASAGTIAGLSEPEIMALATAMSSVGIEAEAGGTAMTQTMTAMTQAVAEFEAGSTEKLGQFADVAGMSAQEFADAWNKEPISAIEAFITGLGSLDERGENATLVLDEMGLSGVRQSNMLRALSLSADDLSAALEMANAEFADGSALSDEFANQQETLSASLGRLKESLGSAAGEIGAVLAPGIEKVAGFISTLAEKFQNLPGPVKTGIVVVGGIVAAIGPLLMVGGTLLTMIGQALVFAPLVVGAIAPIAATLLPIIGIVAAVVAVGVLLYKNWDTIKAKAGELWTWLGEKFSAIKETVMGAWNGIVAGVSAAWESVTGFFTGIGDTISGTWDSVTTFVGEKWNALKEGAATLMEEWRANNEENLTAMATAYQEHGGGIQGTLAAAWAGIRTSGGQFYDALNSLTGGKLDEIRSKFSTAWDTIKSGVSSKWTEIKTSIETKFNEIKDFFLGLPGQALEWGRDFIQGFKDGISERFSSVTSEVTSLGSSIRSLLHFSRPDKGPLRDYETWMPDFMSGLAQGIKANSYKVEDAIADLTYKMHPDISAGTSRTLNYGGTTINVYGRDGQNVRELAREIQQVIASDVAQKEAVFA